MFICVHLWLNLSLGRSLSPAELPKEAASFDLPIAIGLLVASGQLQSDKFERFAAVGELALEGTVRKVKGALAMAIAAREQGKQALIVPVANAQEAAVVEGIEIYAVGSLAEAGMARTARTCSAQLPDASNGVHDARDLAIRRVRHSDMLLCSALNSR